MIRIAIVSSIPPPYGGVSVHVERLLSILRETGVPFCLYEQQGKSDPRRSIVPASRSASWFIRFLLFTSESIVHLHTSSLPAVVAACYLLSMRRKKCIITFHSEHPIRAYERYGRIVRRIVRIGLQRAAHVVAVSQRVADWVLESGLAPRRVTVCPAFLPPTREQLSEDNLSEDIREFLDTHSPIVGTHGWYGSFINGKHVYAFDLLVTLIEEMQRLWPSIGFYTVISGVYEKKHREEIRKTITARGLDRNWLVIERDFHAAALYQKSSVFLRPTLTDGDAVSIRECLWLGVPVLASDAVNRPEGCVTFKTSDLQSLIETLHQMLLNPVEYTKRLPVRETTLGAGPILDIYKEMLTTVESRGRRKK